MAYDVSGTNAVELWQTSGPAGSRHPSYLTPASLTTDAQLLIDGLVVDKATEPSLRPWETLYPWVLP